MMKTYIKYCIIALAGMSAGILLGMYTSKERENIIRVKIKLENLYTIENQSHRVNIKVG